MKKTLLVSLSVSTLFLSTTIAQASWLGDAWDSTKEAASSTWDSVSDKAVEVKEDVKESETTESALENVKKLGDKETYVNTWNDIKESAKNPKDASNEEFGIPE